MFLFVVLILACVKNASAYNMPLDMGADYSYERFKNTGGRLYEDVEMIKLSKPRSRVPYIKVLRSLNSSLPTSATGIDTNFSNNESSEEDNGENVDQIIIVDPDSFPIGSTPVITPEPDEDGQYALPSATPECLDISYDGGMDGATTPNTLGSTFMSDAEVLKH